MYFFPCPFIQSEKISSKFNNLDFTVNSGKNALRIALRSLNLSENSVIGISSFCCNEVVKAIKEEGYIPYYFDLIDEESYWSNYNEEDIIKENIKAIILIHLYGFAHPDTETIKKSCIKNNIHIIHDAAQSYGIDKSIFGKDIVIYSYGPGKSTTAARGGEIVNLPKDFLISLKKPNFLDHISAIVFFNLRLYHNKYARIYSLLGIVVNKLNFESNSYKELTKFQLQKASEVKVIVEGKSKERKIRYDLLKHAIANNQNLRLSFDDETGLYFKIVLFVKDHVDYFLDYLKKNDVPFYRLADSINITERAGKDNIYFKSNCFKFVEISTERSIPLIEINRISKIVEAYNYEN